MAEMAEGAVACQEPGREPSDEVLLGRIKAGDQDAATQLYTRYVTRLRALAKAKCSTALSRRLDADDIVQSVFRMFFQGVRQGFYDVPAGDDLWKLLLVMSLNKIRTKGAYHRAAKRDVRLTNTIEDADTPFENHSASGYQSQGLMEIVVKEALEHLDPRQREMVEMRVQGLEIAEIADMTGRSKRTVERNLQEVRDKLRNLLFQDP
ncbi:MAG TPA: RNA polymerase sigma factor [Gemmataceae bacterium]|jgi:RNA polymerase sigma-70 factor (ECF subfamily)|nr:RNA polymerase sigma factor [Gemmataceae bacterium]